METLFSAPEQVVESYLSCRDFMGVLVCNICFCSSCVKHCPSYSLLWLSTLRSHLLFFSLLSEVCLPPRGTHTDFLFYNPAFGVYEWLISKQ